MLKYLHIAPILKLQFLHCFYRFITKVRLQISFNKNNNLQDILL